VYCEPKSRMRILSMWDREEGDYFSACRSKKRE